MLDFFNSGVAGKSGELRLSISVELLDHALRYLRLRLLFRNLTLAKLVLPYPAIIDFHFTNNLTGKLAEWYTGSLVSAIGTGGFTLQSGETRLFEFLIRPCGVEPEPDDENGDYCRWCVELTNGSYVVWYQFRVGGDYFDPDTHETLRDLERQAKTENAFVWSGSIESNRLQIVRPDCNNTAS